MQQEELKKEELYEIRDLLERVNDSYGHDKLFGTHPRRFMDFTTRTANSAYRQMCLKLHPDNHNQNGYTTKKEKDIATECFVKLQEARKEFNRQNENVDAVRAYLIKENQKRREEKELELEKKNEPPENSDHWCPGGGDLKLAKGAEVYDTGAGVEGGAHLELVSVIEFSEDGTEALVGEPHDPSSLQEWVQTSTLRREFSLYEHVPWHYTNALGEKDSKNFKLKFISSANRTIISKKFAMFARLYENVNFGTHTETKLKEDLIQYWEIMNFEKMRDEIPRNWIEGETTWEPTFKIALTIRGVSIECFVVVYTGFEMDADIFLGNSDWSAFQSRAGDLYYKPQKQKRED